MHMFYNLSLVKVQIPCIGRKANNGKKRNICTILKGHTNINEIFHRLFFIRSIFFFKSRTFFYLVFFTFDKR